MAIREFCAEIPLICGLGTDFFPHLAALLTPTRCRHESSQFRMITVRDTSRRAAASLAALQRAPGYGRCRRLAAGARLRLLPAPSCDRCRRLAVAAPPQPRRGKRTEWPRRPALYFQRRSLRLASLDDASPACLWPGVSGTGADAPTRGLPPFPPCHPSPPCHPLSLRPLLPT